MVVPSGWLCRQRHYGNIFPRISRRLLGRYSLAARVRAGFPRRREPIGWGSVSCYRVHFFVYSLTFLLRIGIASLMLLTMTRNDVISLLRQACNTAPSVRQWAIQNKLSPVYVNYVLSGDRNPGPSILDALGLEREEFTYRRKEET